MLSRLGDTLTTRTRQLPGSDDGLQLFSVANPESSSDDKRAVPRSRPVYQCRIVLVKPIVKSIASCEPQVDGTACGVRRYALYAGNNPSSFD
jgi:hypothetical protein